MSDTTFSDHVNGNPTGIPPHNTDAEQGLLGALMLNNGLLDSVGDIIEPSHFYEPIHGQIYEAVARMHQAGRLANAITLRTIFEGVPPVYDVPVPAYMARLMAAACVPRSAPHYARTIADLAIRRQLIELAGEVSAAAHDAPVDHPPEALIADAEQALFKLGEGKHDQGWVQLGEAVAKVIDKISAAYQKNEDLAGLPTGLADLDAKLGGLQASDLVIIAGRPSMGKAQPLSARIKTRDGWARLGDLRLGQELASVDGRRSLVSGIFPQGQKQIYRVTFSDGRSTECCADHLWRVHHRKWMEPKVLPTSAVVELLQKPCNHRRLWVDLPSGHFGHNESLPIDPWVLGALIGNGNLSGTPCFSTSSTHTAFEMKRAVGDGLAVTQFSSYDFRITRAGGRSEQGVWGVCPNPLSEALKALGLYGLPSEKKFVPEIYKLASRDARIAILRGLLDTDGWVEKWGSIRFVTSSERLAHDFCELARSVGGICTMSTRSPSFTYNGEKKRGLPAFVCNVLGGPRSELLSEPSKRRRVLDAKSEREARLTFLEITPTRVESAACISVTHPDQLYITDEYIVTHNTSLALDVADFLARQGVPVGGFSLEMSGAQLSMRLLSQRAAIASDRLRRGKVSENEFRELVEHAKDVGKLPLIIDESGGLSLAQLTSRARRMKRKHKIGLLVIDYLQLLHGSKRENRTQDVTEITMGLKALAKELDIPVIALSQLSRGPEQRADKRPQLADLRESGSIEQDADVVMFVYREEYYVEREKPTDTELDKLVDWQQRMKNAHGKAEVIIAKNRNGPVGAVQVAFDASLTRFSNLSRGYVEPGDA